MSIRTTGPRSAQRPSSPEARSAPTSAAPQKSGWAPKAAPIAPRADSSGTVSTTATAAVTGGVTLNDLSEPTLMNAQAAQPAGTFPLMHASGPLFVNGTPSYADIDQGQAGDCYFLSTMATIANTHPEVIRDMVKANGDGTYTVTFKQPDGRGGSTDVPVRVDDQFYVQTFKDSNGAVFANSAEYGSSNSSTVYGGDPTTHSEKALWLPLVEKAYAKLKGGSYEAIGNGGWPRNVMQDVLGKPGTYFNASSTTPDDTWNRIKQAVDSGTPICASTLTDAASVAQFTNSGLVHGHAYAVLGASEHDGDRYVKLRNPWGNTEPGNDGANDGVFEMKLTDFLKFYDTVDIASR